MIPSCIPLSSLKNRKREPGYTYFDDGRTRTTVPLANAKSQCHHCQRRFAPSHNPIPCNNCYCTFYCGGWLIGITPKGNKAMLENQQYKENVLLMGIPHMAYVLQQCLGAVLGIGSPSLTHPLVFPLLTDRPGLLAKGVEWP